MLKVRSVSIPMKLFAEAEKAVLEKNKEKLTPGKYTVNRAICEGLALWITTERAKKNGAEA